MRYQAKLHKLFGGLRGDIEERIMSLHIREREKRDAVLLARLDEIHAAGQRLEAALALDRQAAQLRADALQLKVDKLSTQFGIVLLAVVLLFVWLLL